MEVNVREISLPTLDIEARVSRTLCETVVHDVEISISNEAYILFHIGVNVCANSGSSIEIFK
jgi:hypothetical protein